MKRNIVEGNIERKISRTYIFIYKNFIDTLEIFEKLGKISLNKAFLNFQISEIVRNNNSFLS